MPQKQDNADSWVAVASKLPPKPDFYRVRADDSSEGTIAEWRDLHKQGLRWYEHVTASPSKPRKPVLLPPEKVVWWTKVSRADVDAALISVPSVQECVQQTLARYRSTHLKLDAPLDHDASPVPERRRLTVGDEVRIGALKDARVEGVFDEGKTVVLSYQNIQPNYGRPLDLGLAYLGTHWTSVVKKGLGDDSPVLVGPSRLHSAYRNSTLSSLLWRIVRGINTSVDYQRDYAWTYEDKQRLLDSLFAGRDIGRFLFIRNKWPALDDVLDGKQRLTTLADFFTSRLDYQGRYWDELSVRDRDTLEDTPVQFADVDSEQFSRADLLEMFLEVNVAGVPQTEEHLRHVREMLKEARAQESANAS